MEKRENMTSCWEAWGRSGREKEENGVGKGDPLGEKREQKGKPKVLKRKVTIWPGTKSCCLAT